jgi:hypothetical protein
MKYDDKVILWRSCGLDYQKEKEIAEKYFKVVTSRTDLHCRNALVIPRYSSLPFYNELEQDLQNLESGLINTYRQHRYVADLSNWYLDLEKITPKTWFSLEEVPNNVGKVILKGETNSKKNMWKTHMFANNKTEAVEVFLRLEEDGLLGQQQIYIREYVPLVSYANDIVTGMPVTKEFRFFCLDKKILCGGYYWSSNIEDVGFIPDHNEVPRKFLEEVLEKIDGKVRFVVVDVAQVQATGEWIVVELNDGTMSGLSECEPEILYSKLKEIL